MEENAINQFPIGLPSSLKIIILDSNQINSISNEVQPTLNNLTQLETLSLRSNQIKVIHYFQLKPLVKLKNLKLSDNPLVSKRISKVVKKAFMYNHIHFC